MLRLSPNECGDHRRRLPLARPDWARARAREALILIGIFFQIPVRKADRHKTDTFACELELFEWRLMPFEMHKASVTFQTAKALALQKVGIREGSMVIFYIDDIVVATEMVEDHMVRLREVFECLHDAGFKLRVTKCDFRKPEINFLGLVVSAERVK